MSRKVLKASAGTGKTYRLSLEYAISLFQGEKINNIVIMTFTKKATSEIKEDIIKFIKKLATIPKSEEEISDRESAIQSILKIYPTLFTGEEIYEKAKIAYREILLNKDNLKIYTIDGLKNNIFKYAIAPMLNINSYDIIDDNENEPFLKKCFEKLFENRSDFKILKNFLENNTERNIENYISTISGIISDRWKTLLMDKKEREIYKLEDKMYYLDRTIDIIDGIAEEKGKPSKEFYSTYFKPYLNLKTREEKEEFLENNWKDILDKNIHNGNKIKGKALEDDKERLLELKEKIAEELSKEIYNEKVIGYEKEVLSFLERVYEIYDTIKFKEKKFTQEDITNYTIQYINDENLNLVKDGKITDYMREILESEIKTIFIDEFQDTSVAQWKIFKSMIDSAEKVICVGDEKQSIYGWRGGEKDLFVNLTDIIKADEETMDTSYRSRKKIVDFTNDIFEAYSNKAEELGIKWNFDRVNSIDNKDRGYVYLYNGNDELRHKRGKVKSKEELELMPKAPTSAYEKIAMILKQKFNNNYRDVCIIGRENKDLNKMEEYLSMYHIPYFLETNLSIFSHRTVAPIVKLMKYFVSGNIFYLLEFLRDELICVSDKCLKEIITFYTSFETLNNFKFSDEKANKVLESIIILKEKYDENIYENQDIILDMIKEFGILNLYNRESDIKNIYNFIDVSKNFINIRELLDEIKENETLKKYKQSSIEVKNAVTLMTIHKSKGLGYDTVFYIYKEKSQRAESGIQFNIIMSKDYSKVDNYSIIDSKYERILKFLDNSFDFKNYKKLKLQEEEINGVYVAMTRSKKNLFVVVDSLSKESMFKDIILGKYVSDSILEYEIGELSLDKLDEDILLLENKNNQNDFKLDFSKYEYKHEKLEENKEKLESDEFKYDSDREEKRYRGNIVHFFLENLIYLDEESINYSKEKTISKYGASFGKENILRILEGEGMKKFFEENNYIFSKDWDYIYPEYEIYSDINSELYRIDRLMIKLPKGSEKGKILIVDYKTGGYEESQIEKYELAVNERLPERENFEIDKKYLEVHI